MGSFVTWLPDILRDAGVDVYVMPGAETRSTWRSGFDLNAIIWHHTATGPNWADGHVAALLRDGRIDLAGPLSQVGIERDGTWVIVAMGRANHNGARTARYGNDALGLEFYNSGVGEPWPERQVKSGEIGTAAILHHIGSRPVLGHRESDPGRKIDPAGLDMNHIRSRIDARLHAAITPPPPEPEPPTLEDLMSLSVDAVTLVNRTYEAANRPKVDAGGAAYWLALLACTDTVDERRSVINSLRDQLGLQAI